MCRSAYQRVGEGCQTVDGRECFRLSILAHGLLQNLQVRPGKGGKFEVVAGSRRDAALNLLAKQKFLSKLTEIGCDVLDDDEDPVEISLRLMDVYRAEAWTSMS